MQEKKQGFLLIDKPKDWTSFDVVAKLRNITGIKKIGHAGTLDPFATGLLIIAIGRAATKQIDQFVKKDKKYITTLFLGATSDTYDTEGTIQLLINPESSEKKLIINDLKEIEKVLKQFVGKQEQIPPMFSAKKIGGKKLYELARQGKTIKRKANSIEIFSINILDYSWPKLKIRVHCSSGTYIRSLGNDIGKALGVGAYLTELRRTHIGKFSVNKAFKIEKIKKETWGKNLNLVLKD